jgi:hypothetical protein
MTTTVATVATEVQRRLRISTPGGSEPATATVADYIRLGFKHLIGLLPPIQETNTTLSISTGEVLSASVTANRVFFVSTDEKLLVPGQEWNKSGNTLYFHRSVGNSADRISVWHTALFTIVTGTEATVNTTCIFGLDWLEELATLYAEMLALGELARNSGSASGPQHGAQYRAVEATYQEAFKQAKSLYEQWYAEKRDALQLRLASGDTPMVPNRLSALINRSEIRGIGRP